MKWRQGGGLRKGGLRKWRARRGGCWSDYSQGDREGKREESATGRKKKRGVESEGKKNIIAMQQDCNEYVMVFLVPHIKLIGVYFSPRVKCVPMCHIFTRQLQNLTALVTLPLIQA